MEIKHQNKILCCDCGVPIEPNPANTCVSCIRTKVDITEGIVKQSNLQWCKGCERYMNQNSQYIACSLESKELLAICLKKLKGLNQVKLMDASFIWTEPHSKRVKVKLLIQKEVNGGALLQQSLTIEYIVMNQMCNDCHKREAKDFWKAVVQVRQRVGTKRTFYYLEQLILKHKVASRIINIKPEHGGLDFYFSTKDDARKFCEFIQNIIPCKQKYSQRLISHDIHNNSYNYKSNYSIEIIPVVKDSIVCFSPKLAHSLGMPGKNRLAICYKLTRSAHFVDPLSLHTFEITSTMYANNNIGVSSGPNSVTSTSDQMGLEVLCTLDKLQRFVVMDIEAAPVSMQYKQAFNNSAQTTSQLSLATISGAGSIAAASTGTLNTMGTEKSRATTGFFSRHGEDRFAFAEAWVCRDTSDISNFGAETLFCRTHLGNILKPGDYVLGLHMPTCNINNKYLERMKESEVPDVILVKKIYPDDGKPRRNGKSKHKANGKRVNKKLKNNAKLDEVTTDGDVTMAEEFHHRNFDLDEDIANENYGDILAVEAGDDELNSAVPTLSLQEMLEDFHME